MSRAVVSIQSDKDRASIIDWVRKAPNGSRVTLHTAKRTVPQNSHLWALLTDLSRQLAWHGQRLTPDDWKLVMLDALNREVRIVPSVDGRGFVNLGRSSSALSKGEMVELIELIMAFGAQHGVEFHNPEARAA